MEEEVQTDPVLPADPLFCMDEEDIYSWPEPGVHAFNRQKPPRQSSSGVQTEMPLKLCGWQMQAVHNKKQMPPQMEDKRACVYLLARRAVCHSSERWQQRFSVPMSFTPDCGEGTPVSSETASAGAVAHQRR